MPKDGVFIDVLAAFLTLFLAVYYQHYSKVSTDLANYAFQNLNNTAKSDNEGLVFNRVPKVGSETIWSLIDRLGKVNSFNTYSDSADVKAKRGSENTYLTSVYNRREYFQILTQNITKPYSYVKHLNFLDLNEFNVTNPVYINFVRNPVDRVISWYYYTRAPWHIVKWDKDGNETKLSDRIPSIYELKMPFEDCVLQRKQECVYNKGQSIYASMNGGSHYSQATFFCGMGEECGIFESPKLLAKAKENVEKHYAVIGVLEEMEKSLTTLESYVPRFFKGARRVYYEMMKGYVKNKNKYKPKTPKYIKDMLTSNFTLEIEFYEFCKQRLNRQYLAIM